MRLFVFVFVAVSIYTAMNAVVLWGVQPLVATRPELPALVVTWMGAMILAPLVVPLLKRGGYETTARALAWVAYCWLGFLFLASLCFTVLAEWEWWVWMLGSAFPVVGRFSVHGVGTALAGVVVALGVGLYGLWEAKRLGIVTVPIPTNKLGGQGGRLTIVQVSDLHLGLLHRERTLARVLDRLREVKPDLLVATGDMVDAQIDHLDSLSDLWRAFDPPLGKFAVVGNHEVYAGLGQSLGFLTRSGFEVLRNESRAVGDVLTLVGIDDDHARGDPVDEVALLQRQPEDRFTVVLKHRPTVAVGATKGFDLQLSGHTHLGQIFPFRLLTALRYPLQNGLYDLPGGAKLYTSRGAGTWGPPMRVLAPPEITVFEITAARPGAGSRQRR